MVAGLTYEDPTFKVFPGRAHLSSTPFGRRGMWSGSSWRKEREFVGKVRHRLRTASHLVLVYHSLYAASDALVDSPNPQNQPRPQPCPQSQPQPQPPQP